MRQKAVTKKGATVPITEKPDCQPAWRTRHSVWSAASRAGRRASHRRYLFAFVLLLAPGNVWATADSICDRAAQIAARESGVPYSVLWSITRTETGRNRNGQLQPWPWTVNMEGEGRWFDTEDAARAYVFKHFKRGARSFDVGCFQINFKWHGTAFQSIDQMFDPVENARYAADFLKRLYDETGDWSAAAGAYHSRTPEFAQRYRTRFDRIRSGRDGSIATPPTIATVQTQPNTRINAYPLLRLAGVTGRNGSLVPMSDTGARALFDLPGANEGS